MRPRSSLWLSLYAGLSSLFVTLLYQAIKSFVALPRLDQLHLAETVIIVSVGLSVIERFLSLLKASPLEGTLTEGREGLLLRPLLVFVLLSISDGLLHDYLSRTVVPRGFNGIEQLVLSLVAPSVITFSWLYGLSTTPRRARIYGLYAAILVGSCFFTIVIIALIQYTPKSASLRTLSRFEETGVYIVVGLTLFSWVLTSAVPSGFLGGLAVDRGWCHHAWQRIAIGLGVAASVAPIAMFIFGALLSELSGKKLPNSFAWSFILEPTIGNIGWALGFALIADADAIFQSERTKPSGSLSLIRESARVAWVTGLMIVLLVIFSLACMAIPTRLILMAGSHQPNRPFASAFCRGASSTAINRLMERRPFGAGAHTELTGLPLRIEFHFGLAK